ncbi:stage III sporulation protein AG [uncultured Clostridium sp.]|uniref:stage III sporulation protein AG n=1 Tax=uncultured Clostridium sp. TaxID=59620 RepID=UPI0026203FD7|nr:stage III sporulation protein AG [uncultured Clostridium sp.]
MEDNKIEIILGKLKKNKKVGPLLIILLVLIIIGFGLSYLGDINNISKKEEGKVTILNGDEDASIPTIDHEYEEKQRTDLSKILSKIEGVGNVEVMLRFGGSEIKVPATDNNNKQSTTEETDSEGGKRVNTEALDDDKVVMKNDEDGNSPYILETKKPEVTGVMIVAQGAQDSKVKYEISKAVASLYDISLEDVSIFPMEESK